MSQVVNCIRCGRPCKTDTPDPAKRQIRRTDHAAYCPNCVVTQFLLSVEPIRQTIEGSPARGGIVPAVPGKGSSVLLLPHIQEKIGRVLEHTQLSLAEIDWPTVVAQWDLPWPKP